MKRIPMQRGEWNGVFPAITTPFRADDSIDLELFGRHAAWMAGHGCAAIVTPGSLGEGGLLTLDEKRSLWSRAVESVPDSVPVIAAVGACGTREAEGIARAAEEGAQQREAFGKRLIDQPLMRNVLADLSLESEAAALLALRLARAFDGRHARDEHEALLARVLTPAAKYWICKRLPAAAARSEEPHV